MTPWATTAAVATVVAVRATGEGPMTAARRTRLRAIPMLCLLLVLDGVVFFEDGQQCLNRYASTGDELAAFVPDR